MTTSPDFRTAVERLVSTPSLPDVTMRQLAVVLIVRDNHKTDCTIKSMSARLKINKGAITRAADRLTELGFATREVNLEDRRVVFIRLTPAGQRFAKQLPASQFEMGRAA